MRSVEMGGTEKTFPKRSREQGQGDSSMVCTRGDRVGGGGGKGLGALLGGEREREREGAGGGSGGPPGRAMKDTRRS